MTLRAAERLKKADVLVWTDSLVCPAIAALAPEHCERIRTSTLTLEEVIPVLIERHRQGRQVVRLHDGDTSLYSAIHEQISALSDAEVPVEVVPGLSAYQAAAARLGQELTVPGLVQTIVLGAPAAEQECQSERISTDSPLWEPACAVSECPPC